MSPDLRFLHVSEERPRMAWLDLPSLQEQARDGEKASTSVPRSTPGSREETIRHERTLEEEEKGVGQTGVLVCQEDPPAMALETCYLCEEEADFAIQGTLVCEGHAQEIASGARQADRDLRARIVELLEEDS